MNPPEFLRSSLVLFLAVFLLGLTIPISRAAAQAAPALPGQFAYVEDGRRLYLVRGSVDEPVLLMQTEGPFAMANLHFSRGGHFLAYCIDDTTTESDPRLYYLDTLTFEKVEVTTEGSCSYDWWQDGKTLVFSTSLSPSPAMALDQGIWSYSLESGALEVLVRTDSPVIDPRWSSDGRTLSYFDYCFECVGQFHTYDLITGVTMDWSQEGTDQTIGPDVDWSPDGKTLAFDEALWMYAGEGETYGIESAGSNGESWKDIYSQPGQGAFFPTWSPDGKRLAFASFESFTIGTYVNRRADLMEVSPDGMNAKKLYSSVYEVFPQAWSPDGRYMLIMEPISISQDSIQKEQLVLVDMQSGGPLWKTASLGPLTADWAPIPARPDAQPKPSVPMAAKAGLLFVSPDEALAFYEPVSGQLQKLTAPFSGRKFSLSPDGRIILFGDQIVSMQARADGSVSPTIVESSQPMELDTLSWSPDGQRFGYVDRNGSAWVEDLQGSAEQLYEGDLPPAWSYDGQWMAYCDKEGRLWIAETGKPADWIVQQENCAVNWSPTQSILAYTTYPSFSAENYADGTAFLYDPVGGGTKEIARSMSGVDWSPDGKLISIGRITSMGASNYSYSITVINPDTGQEIYLDEYNPEMYDNHTWIGQADGYLFGRYRFQADLLAAEQAAEVLIDATQDGNRLLVSSGDPSALEIGCRDMEANTTYPLLNVTRSDTPGAAMPGLAGKFSPDGNWILIGDYVVDRTINWLAQCNDSPPVQLSKNAWLLDQYFSPDSVWLVMEDTHPEKEMIPRIVLQELESGSISEIQAGLNTHSAWFQMPAAPVIPESANVQPVATLPAASTFPPAATEIIPIESQSGSPKGSSPVAMVSILLWAGALIAIMILMLYLWRQSSATPKQVKDQVPETPLEENVPPAAEPAPKPSHEEMEKAFHEGVQLTRAGRAAEGISKLTKVITAEPENAVGWFWLGIASARQKDYRSAERCFLQAKRYGHPEADKALEWLKGQKK